MYKQFCLPQNPTSLFFMITCVVLVASVVFFSSKLYAADVGDKEVIAFFQSVEEAFKKKDVLEIIRHIDRDFSYVMTYSTSDNFSFLESDFEKYRANVGSFFKSKPEIHEYSIVVDNIQRSGEDIFVLARIKSVVQLSGILNSCEASSNYIVHYEDGEFFINGVRGDADCINKTVN